MLMDAVPDIAPKIELPDLKDVIEFFSMQHGALPIQKKNSDEGKSLSNKLLDIRAVKE